MINHNNLYKLCFNEITLTLIGTYVNVIVYVIIKQNEMIGIIKNSMEGSPHPKAAWRIVLSIICNASSHTNAPASFQLKT